MDFRLFAIGSHTVLTSWFVVESKSRMTGAVVCCMKVVANGRGMTTVHALHTLINCTKKVTKPRKSFVTAIFLLCVIFSVSLLTFKTEIDTILTDRLWKKETKKTFGKRASAIPLYCVQYTKAPSVKAIWVKRCIVLVGERLLIFTAGVRWAVEVSLHTVCAVCYSVASESTRAVTLKSTNRVRAVGLWVTVVKTALQAFVNCFEKKRIRIRKMKEKWVYMLVDWSISDENWCKRALNLSSNIRVNNFSRTPCIQYKRIIIMPEDPSSIMVVSLLSLS